MEDGGNNEGCKAGWVRFKGDASADTTLLWKTWVYSLFWGLLPQTQATHKSFNVAVNSHIVELTQYY